MTQNKPEKTRKPIKVSRIVGYGLFIFGVLNIVDMISPIPIPTVGISAIVAGILFMGTGMFLLIPDKGKWLSVIRGILQKRPEPRRQKAIIDPLLPVKILKLAQKYNGILTLSKVAVELNIPLGEAEAGLDECVRYGHATADYDMNKELKFYRFQENLPPET
jgi:hypothetical protein